MNKTIVLLLAIVSINGMNQNNLEIVSFDKASSTESSSIFLLLPFLRGLEVKLVDSNATFKDLKCFIEKNESIPVDEQLFYITHIRNSVPITSHHLPTNLPDHTLVNDIILSYKTNLFTICRPLKPLPAELNRKIAHLIAMSKNEPFREEPEKTLN